MDEWKSLYTGPLFCLTSCEHSLWDMFSGLGFRIAVPVTKPAELRSEGVEALCRFQGYLKWRSTLFESKDSSTQTAIHWYNMEVRPSLTQKLATAIGGTLETCEAPALMSIATATSYMVSPPFTMCCSPAVLVALKNLLPREAWQEGH